MKQLRSSAREIKLNLPKSVMNKIYSPSFIFIYEDSTVSTESRIEPDVEWKTKKSTCISERHRKTINIQLTKKLSLFQGVLRFICPSVIFIDVFMFIVLLMLLQFI